MPTSREAQAMVSLGAAEPLTGSEALRAWWSSFPSPSNRPTFVRRAGPYRMAELAGAWRGSRPATELDGPLLPDLLARSGHGAPAEPSLPWI